MLFKKIRFLDVDEEPETLWNPSFIMVLVFGFLSGCANQMINPQLSKYAVSLGATLPLAGTIVGLQSGMAMFLRPLSGVANDVLNRKHVMIGSIFIAIASFTGYMIFPSIAGVIVFRSLQGFSFAFMSVSRTAFATAYIPKDRMGEGIGFTSFGVVLSQAVAPGIGLWVSENWGYNFCFLLALCFSVFGAAMLSLLPYKHVKREFRRHDLRLRNLIAVEVLPYAFLAGMFSISIQMCNSFLALLGDERGIPGVAIFFTVYSIVALITRPVAGRILDKLGLPILLYPSFIFAVLTFMLLGAAQSITLIIIAGVFRALSQGVALPSIQGMAIIRLGRDRAGVASSTIFMGQDLLNTLAPAVGGVLAASIGYAQMFYVFAAFTLFGIPLYTLLRRYEKRRGIGQEHAAAA
jgi:predicted MFS family arabinose efflux permease